MKSLRILLVGSGAREHALAWKLSQSDLVEHIFISPGNGANVYKATSVKLDDFDSLVKFAVENQVNLVVPGPEQPLVDGIEAVFRKVGIPVFGPSQLAARMEGSKVFSKSFMARHAIPTAAFRVFPAAQVQDAINYVKTCGHRVVLKADGLAGGKGVLIPETVEEAEAGLHEILIAGTFGNAGSQVVIEEFLDGSEISVLAFSDGYTVAPLPAGQDHKRVGEGDVGPNTGGMGVYAPVPVATQDILSQIMNQVLRPTIDGMRKEGFPFVGMLFTGLILTSSGPRVLEYNVRFGDPETEALVLLLSEKTDLAVIMLACVEHRLDSVVINTRPGAAVSVVLASAGYPGKYETGKIIRLPQTPSGVTIFHAGTKKSGDTIVTAGGRVLVVGAYAATLQGALDLAYSTVEKIQFEGKLYRRDIAHRALASSGLSHTDSVTYAQAGVSVEAGNALVEAIKPYIRTTRRPGASAEIGGFGGVFDLQATGYNDPILVSGTDGVGTKLQIAVEAGIHSLVGIDLVAMSVNDLLVQGAEPLFFLDYFACSKLDVAIAAEVVKGIVEGCRQSGCALIGGETAEMPDMYRPGDYDLAGFAVGAVERQLLLPRTDISVGDILLGIASSGVHSNGFSLIRKVIRESGLQYASACPWDKDLTLGRSLLEPTRIYVKQVLPAAKLGLIKAMSHITGGGFLENVPRMLPKHLGCYINASAWKLPPVFRFIRASGVAPMEMARTFNNGIGFVVVVDPAQVDAVTSLLRQQPGEIYRIGQVTETPGVEMRSMNLW